MGMISPATHKQVMSCIQAHECECCIARRARPAKNGKTQYVFVDRRGAARSFNVFMPAMIGAMLGVSLSTTE